MKEIIVNTLIEIKNNLGQIIGWGVICYIISMFIMMVANRKEISDLVIIFIFVAWFLICVKNIEPDPPGMRL